MNNLLLLLQVLCSPLVLLCDEVEGGQSRGLGIRVTNADYCREAVKFIALLKYSCSYER